MKYPTAANIEEMKDRGYDPAVIAGQIELAKRGEVLDELKVAVRRAFVGVTDAYKSDRERIQTAVSGYRAS